MELVREVKSKVIISEEVVNEIKEIDGIIGVDWLLEMGEYID